MVEKWVIEALIRYWKIKSEIEFVEAVRKAPIIVLRELVK